MGQVKFKKPSRIESFGIAVMLFSLFALYQAAHIWPIRGIDWHAHFTANIPLHGGLMFWMFFLLFHISTMFIMARSVLDKSKHSTWNGYDFVVGFTMIFGLYLIAISTIYSVWMGTPNIEFLFDLPYQALLNLGFAIQGVGVLWFAFTN